MIKLSVLRKTTPSLTQSMKKLEMITKRGKL